MAGQFCTSAMILVHSRGENLRIFIFPLDDNDQHFGGTRGGPLLSYFGDQRILYFGDREIIRWGLRTHPTNGYALRLLGGQQYLESSNLVNLFILVIIPKGPGKNGVLRRRSVDFLWEGPVMTFSVAGEVKIGKRDNKFLRWCCCWGRLLSGVFKYALRCRNK